MTAEIKLPPFPEGMCLREDIEDYARAAVEADRKRGGVNSTHTLGEPECNHCGGTGDVSGEYPGIADCAGTGKVPQPAVPAQVQHVDDINVADIPAVSAKHATLNLQPSSSMQPVATAFFTEKGEVAFTGLFDRTLKALEAVKTTRMGISSGSIDLYAAPQPAEPVKRKRRYAQGTALGEFGIIPMCDQVDDEPVKVPSDDLAHEIWAAAQTAPGEGIEDAVERVAALLARRVHHDVLPWRSYESHCISEKPQEKRPDRWCSKNECRMIGGCSRKPIHVAQRQEQPQQEREVIGYVPISAIEETPLDGYVPVYAPERKD